MWMSSFVSFVDNFNKCISTGLNVGALPTVDVRPPAHILTVEDIAVLPLTRPSTHTVPESCFKEAMACEISICRRLSKTKFGEASMLSSFLFYRHLKKIAWIIKIWIRMMMIRKHLLLYFF